MTILDIVKRSLQKSKIYKDHAGIVPHYYLVCRGNEEVTNNS